MRSAIWPTMLRMIQDVIIHEISLFGRGVPLACVVFSAAAGGNRGQAAPSR
jgi:hypothetical protein